MSDRTRALGRGVPWVSASLVVLALGLGACSDRGNGTTAGEKVDAAIAKTQDAASRAADQAQVMAKEARNKVEASEPALREGAARVKAAASDAGAAVVGTVDDVAITAAVSKDLAKDPELSAARIDVDTTKGAVKLQGPAPSAAAKLRAGEIAKAVDGVASVDNRLVVGTL